MPSLVNLCYMYIMYIFVISADCCMLTSQGINLYMCMYNNA